MSKSSIRKSLRAQRRALSLHAQDIAARQLSRQLSQSGIFRKAQHIAAYWPHDGEISPLPFLQTLQRSNKKLYLPRVLDNGHLCFRYFHYAGGLSKNRYGIPEPASKQQRNAHALDIVLIPLVAFDDCGNRLGMGKGYYDKTFARQQQYQWRRKPLLIGLAHHFQQLDRLAHDHWDIPLHAIVTDHGIINIRPHRKQHLLP